MKRLILVILLAGSALLLPASAADNAQAAKPADIKVTVTGCVGNPGVVWLGEHRTLDSAIALAGSFTRSADRRVVRVTSKNGEKKSYDFNELSKQPHQTELKEGDIISVPDRADCVQPEEPRQ
jgi:protein involved in polysaccharide export with SLBB domain